MPDPYISVIVTAHDRRRYLPEALRSLERQTLDKTKFEVIVVKNFEDPVSDEIIRRNSWKNIITDVRPLGGKLAIGIQESGGEVITFLEDDDLYRPERLQVIEKAFKDIKNLVYFHNDQTVIDENGNAIPDTAARLFVPAGILKTSILIDERIKQLPCSLDYVIILFRAEFNNSSIAVRKDLLEPSYLEMLKALSGGVDLYLYARAFASDGSLYLTPLTLTMYRVHLDSVSGYLVPSTVLTYLREGRLQELRERIRLAKLRKAIVILESAPVVYKLARANCDPVNVYWQYYIGGRFDWITYSRNALLIGRSSLLELLRTATIYALLHRRYHKAKLELAAKLSSTSEGLTESSYGARNALREAVSDLFAQVSFAIIFGTSRYLLQFLPWSVKERFLEFRLKLDLYEGLRNVADNR